MSTLIPVGQIRHNMNTMMNEVWDGKSWITIDDGLDSFTPISVHNGGHTITTSNAAITTSMGFNGTSRMADVTREDMFEFLKTNLRVAEYLDETGKVDYVQLELREGEGCNWENIQRVRIK